MSDFPPEELGKEIDRLWAKVSASSPTAWESLEAVAPAEPTTGRELAWETMALLKKQHRHETRYWAEVLEAKERAVRAGAERLAFLELEVNRLREKARADEARHLTDGLDSHAKAEAAFKALQEERVQHEREQQSLRALLEQTRERLAAEASRVRQEREAWEKKERQHLLDLQELRALAQRREQENGQAGEKAKALEGSLDAAKNALEKTLAELLRERQIREESEAERAKALKKVDELQKHFEELSRIWEEERSQWRELWDRERSTWETQRGEFSSWEDKLRKEREAWLAEVQAKERDQALVADRISASLKASSEATSRLTGLMERLSAARRWSGPAWLPRAALAVILAACAAWPAWRSLTRLHFKPELTRAVDLANPTSLGFDGNLLWVAEWDGSLLAFDPQSPAAPARSAKASPGGPYRPVSLAFGGGSLWTLDAAQARIVRHDAERPDKIVWTRPSPGPAPTALAYDGQSLWSFDAANKTLYRHGQDEGSYKAVSLGEDVVATAMAWVAGQLWLVDAKSGQLLVFDYKEEAFKLAGRYRLPDPAIGLAPVGRRLWLLAGPRVDRTGDALVQYSY